MHAGKRAQQTCDHIALIGRHLFADSPILTQHSGGFDHNN
jgi:hypothetical protein